VDTTTLRLPADLRAPVEEASARAIGERCASAIRARDTGLRTQDEAKAARSEDIDAGRDALVAAFGEALA
jgi:hypothetical protein